jgi:hypothetical protein
MAQVWQSDDGLIRLRDIDDDVDLNGYEFMQRIRNHYRKNNMKVPEKYEITPGQLASGAKQNLWSSLYQVGEDLVTAIANPLDTVANLLQVTRGGIHNFMPDKVFESGILDKDEEAMQKASMLGNFYKNRYGGIEEAKETFAKDPAAVLADLSTFLTAGAGALKAVSPGGTLEKLASGGRKAGELLDPLRLVGYGLQFSNKYGFSPLGKLAKIGGSRLAGVGARPLENAFSFGKDLSQVTKQNRARADFWKYYSGAKNPLTIVDELQNGLKALSAKNSEMYRKGVEALKQNPTVPSYQKLGDALNKINAEVVDTASGFTMNAPVGKILEDVNKIIQEFGSNPKVQNLYGFELLRKRIQSDIKDTINFDSKAGRAQARAVDQVLTAIKDTISAADPNYNKTIRNYAEAASDLNDFRSTLGGLSKKDKAKALSQFLQSINNPTGDFKVTFDMVKDAEVATGRNIEAMLSGVILSVSDINNFSGRGLVGLGGAQQVVDIPGGSAAGLPLSMPRIAGGIAYGAGRVKGVQEALTPGQNMRGLFNLGVQPTRAGITEPAPTSEEELMQLLQNKLMNR